MILVRSPTRTYIPLQVSSPQAGAIPAFTPPTTSSPVKFDEGIERVKISQQNISLSPGQLVILGSDEPSKEKDPDTDDDPSVCEVSALLPYLSSTVIRDVTFRRPQDKSVAPTVAVTTSLRFSSIFWALQAIHHELKLLG